MLSEVCLRVNIMLGRSQSRHFKVLLPTTTVENKRAFAKRRSARSENPARPTISLPRERKPARLRVSDWSAIVSIAGRLEGASGTLAL